MGFFGQYFGSYFGNYFAAVGEIVAAATTPPGGSSDRRKRKRLTLKGRLSEAKIRELIDKVHKKRRAIWERPKPEAPVEATPKPAEPVHEIAAYVDLGLKREAEVVSTAIDLARVRARLREERAAIDAENRRIRAERVAALLERRAAEEAFRKARDEEEALITLLLAA